MKNFFEGKGFYIVLALCVASIGAVGYVNFSNVDDQTLSENSYEIILPDYEIPTISPSVEDESTATYIPSLDVPVIEAEVVMKKDDEPLEPNGNGGHDDILSVEPTKPSQTIYIEPVEHANVLQENSMNELVKDITMNDWRTHNATDFEAEAGDYILAISNGVVASIETSDLHATVVTIEHECGLITKTYGLNSDTICKVGDKVYAGDVLGTAIGIIPFEQNLPSHIHVEATRDGENVNILELFDN